MQHLASSREGLLAQERYYGLSRRSEFGYRETQEAREPGTHGDNVVLYPTEAEMDLSVFGR